MVAWLLLCIFASCLANEWPCAWPMLKENSISPPQHNNTKVIQSVLNEKLGTNLFVNGLYGPAVTKAVVQFQLLNGLTPDGVFGNTSWTALLNYTVEKSNILSIKAVQILLRLPETGILDSAFTRAIHSFQLARGINPSSVVDPETWHILISDCYSSQLYGFDIGWPEGLASFESLSCVYNLGFSFAVFEVYTEGHKLWEDGIKNIITAQKVGFPFVNAYHYPLRSQDPGEQVTIVAKALAAANVTITNVWLDIEGTKWNNYTQKDNADFVMALRVAYEDFGYKVGLYCGRQYPTYFGDFTGFSDVPVWYAHYDLIPSFVDWWGQPYGGWTAPSVKQFYDRSAGPETKCKLTIDWDWAPNSDPFQ